MQLLIIISLIILIVLVILVAMLFSQINKINIQNQKIESIMMLSNKENELQEVEKSILLNFNNLGNMLGKTMFDNSQLLSKNIDVFKDEFRKSLTDDFDKLNRHIETKLEGINNKVEERLSKGFEETTKTFTSVLERLSKIDEAQKKIESLSTNIVSLQDVLTDKKSRGIFGEVQLYQILTSIFGEKNDKIFNTQYKLSNGTLVDAILFAPEPIGNIAIDSKFPLENYRRMYDVNTSEQDKLIARKDFATNLKKHIDDISSKYIIQGETSDQAILFLPAEAIFAEINAYHTGIIEYANNKKVWIASPTTLMSVLTTLQVVLMNLERDKYAHIIQEELMKLGQEFERYQKRWGALEKDIDKVLKDVKEVTTTSNKISRRFDEISNVKLVNNNHKINAVDID